MSLEQIVPSFLVEEPVVEPVQTEENLAVSACEELLEEETSEESMEESTSSVEEVALEDTEDQFKFMELADTILALEKNISENKKMMAYLLGTPENPSTFWNLLDIYGKPLDSGETGLNTEGVTWAFQNVGGGSYWCLEDCSHFLHVAYRLSKSSEEESEHLFLEFKNTLSAMLDEEPTLTDEEWWRFIDDCADLYLTATKRKVDPEALEKVKDCLNPLFLQAFKVEEKNQYEIHWERTSEELPCRTCSKVVSVRDCFCKHCGDKL